METTPEVFEQTWRLHELGAFLWSRHVVSGMLSVGRGSILITGATAGVRPWPNSAAFGPAKFAVRGLAQVMARDLHPQGIHVVYVNVDGAIDMPIVRSFWPQAKDEDLLSRTRSPMHSGTSPTRIEARGHTSSTYDRSRRSSSARGWRRTHSQPGGQR
jgi:NAD(P)-dependent dehydrogenase (short-subunit alcohol dehydrogenase family)